MNKIKPLLLSLLLASTACSFAADPGKGDKAAAFINSLNDSQKAKALFPVSDTGRNKFVFLPPATVPRMGLKLKEIDSLQKIKLFVLLNDFLSDEGMTKVKNIIGLENVLRDLEKSDRRDEGLYVVAFFGMPGKDTAWSWKFEGHHLSLNFTVVKNEICFAPLFMGSNPAEIREGPYKGFRALKNEEDEGYALMKLFSDQQKQKVIFSKESLNEIVTFNTSQVSPLEPAGMYVKEMSAEQKKQLNKLIDVYLSNLPPILADKRRKKINEEDMNELQFGWAGSDEPGKPHYYRIQGKNFLIELDNAQNNANHIHSVWRDFYGDFGRDLLMEHYGSTHHQH
ncbi:MAG: DUF3500 domain-containing protein [Bacteroidota bacterium]|nr:DUF3500 domain-containing protein [Bacteroidota bacterium]